MIKIVENCNSKEISASGRFDVKYFYLGEILDKILKNFDVSPLINYTKFIKKGIFDLNSRYYRTSGIPFIRISNLKSFSIDESSMVYIPIKNHQKEIKTKLVPGDLALSKVGKYLGKIGQVPLRYEEVNISQNIVGVSFNCTEEIRKYIFLYLTTPIAINQIIRVSKAHNQNKLTLPDIRNLRIPMLSEKKVKYYSKFVDKITHLENDAFVLLEDLKNNVSDELGINNVQTDKNVTFISNLSFFRKDSFFTPEFSNPLYNDMINYLNKNFKTVSLGEICTIIKGDEVGKRSSFQVFSAKLVHTASDEVRGFRHVFDVLVDEKFPESLLGFRSIISRFAHTDEDVSFEFSVSLLCSCVYRQHQADGHGRNGYTGNSTLRHTIEDSLVVRVARRELFPCRFHDGCSSSGCVTGPPAMAGAYHD